MTNYKNVTLSENGLFKNNNTLLRFGVDELTIIHENINTTLKELTELTGLSKSTISRIKQGIKKGYFDDYINNNDTMEIDGICEKNAEKILEAIQWTSE